MEGYAQIPAPKERCEVSGLKRSTFIDYLKKWKKHPVHPVGVVTLTRPNASRGITLYSKGDLKQLLDYEAKQEASA